MSTTNMLVHGQAHEDALTVNQRDLKEDGFIVSGRKEAGRRVRPDQQANPLTLLGNNFPQTRHLLV